MRKIKLLVTILPHFLAGTPNLTQASSGGPFWVNSWLGARSDSGVHPGWEPQVIATNQNLYRDGSYAPGDPATEPEAILACFLAGSQK